MNTKPTVAIVGFGRFGKTLYRMIKDDFSIILFNRHSEVFRNEIFNKKTKIANSIKDIYRANVIFYAVPIDQFEYVIKTHKRHFAPHHVLIDVLSVKEYPEEIFTKYLKNTKTQAILTHPMFGPDSSKHGFKGLTIMMNQFLANEKSYTFWKNYFVSKGLKIEEMSAKEHDRLAASSQGVTHFIGRMLEHMKFKPTPINTLGAKKLYEIMSQTCHDNWRLFKNLQLYNPYIHLPCDLT